MGKIFRVFTTLTIRNVNESSWIINHLLDVLTCSIAEPVFLRVVLLFIIVYFDEPAERVKYKPRWIIYLHMPRAR